MIKLSKSKGFTLIELMIVVAIIAILAAIAIPNFLKFMNRSKTAEAKTNLGAIRVCEVSYHGENDVYIPCTPYPAVATVGPTPQIWDETVLDVVPPHGFYLIGFAPDGDPRYSYQVIPSVPLGGVDLDGNITFAFAAIAIGDIDGDALTGGGTSAYCVDSGNTGALCTNTGPGDDGEYPRAVKNPSAGTAAAIGGDDDF